MKSKRAKTRKKRCSLSSAKTVRKKKKGLKRKKKSLTGKNPVGRPTKYCPEILDKVQQYRVEYKLLNQVIPSVAGLAVYLSVSRDTIYEWCKEHPRFSDILDDILSDQESILLNMGLSGKFNSNITKLVLGKHGYHERRDTELSGKDGKPIKIASRDLSSLDPSEAERVYKALSRLSQALILMRTCWPR